MSITRVAVGLAGGTASIAAFSAPIYKFNAHKGGGDSGQQPFVAMVILGTIGLAAGGYGIVGGFRAGGGTGVGGKAAAIAGRTLLSGIGGLAMGGAVWLARPAE
jgi:hypothetical protein